MDERHEKNAPDSPVEIPERVDGLESPIRNRQQFCNHTEIRLAGLNMSQSLSKIVAEQPHMNRHFIERRRLMLPDLHIPVTETAGPIREQRPG